MNTLTTLNQLTKTDIREKISAVENKMFLLPSALAGDSPEYLAVCPLKHTFVDGAYVREIFIPKGMAIVTKIHKKTHPYFILKGDVSILTDRGAERIKGPKSGITPAGTKRFIYTHEDTIWITVHVTGYTDLDQIEADVIAKNFDEIETFSIIASKEEENVRIIVESFKENT